MTPIINTLFIGKVFYSFQTLPSTNTYAAELLTRETPPEGTIISTDIQSHGRGQMGNTWESAPYQNIALSLILYPHFLPIHQQFLLNQIISLAVCATLRHFCDDVAIKWPNDIYIKHNKIAGILIQTTLSGQKFQTAIVGIGININQTEFSSGAPNPTSLVLELGKETDLTLVVEKLCEHIEVYYLKLRSGKTKEIEQDYLNNLYQYRQIARYQRVSDGFIFDGMIRGVTDSGQLIMEHNHWVEMFDLKQIKFL